MTVQEAKDHIQDCISVADDMSELVYMLEQLIEDIYDEKEE